MHHEKRALFSNFSHKKLKNLLLSFLVCLYIAYFIGYFAFGSFGEDYLAFWSVGKIADEKGYSQIYDLNTLRIVQMQERYALRVIKEKDESTTALFPVPYFSFFVVPFQFISRIDLIQGYFFWTIINLVIQTGYLYFLIKRLNPGRVPLGAIVYFLILVLISFPVFSNIFNGQVGVVLLVCVGEFLRNAVGKKPVLAGLWLGGLLLKPQLLIIILPAFLVMRAWKVLLGFAASSAMIIMTSFLLSGLAGMQALVSLWTDFSVGMDSNFPEVMINWRMLGFNLNALFNTSLGWVITGAGMVLTLLAVILLVRRRPLFGSLLWVVTMLGVFTATLAVTWHSHYHMAMVVIPFLIYAALNKLLPERIIFLWGFMATAAWFLTTIFALFAMSIVKVYDYSMPWLAAAFSGFVLNLIVFISIIKTLINKKSDMQGIYLRKNIQVTPISK